jgi:putative phage-type endonuclease
MSKYLSVRGGLSDEEKARRRATLGSSEIAAVVGVNPWQSVHQVWLSKVHCVDFEGNEATALGNILEPTILSIYSERYGRPLVRGVYTTGREPWMSCTPDAVLADGSALVEAKLVGLRSLWMWGSGNIDEQESDAVPMHYLCQCQWQCAVMQKPFVDVAALMGTEFRTYRIRSDPKVQSQLISRGRDFWDRYVVTRHEPPVDASDGAREMLAKIYPRSDAEPVPANPKLDELTSALALARESLKRAAAEKQLRENQIKAELRDARGAFGEGWRIRYATTRAGTRPFVFETDKERAA